MNHKECLGVRGVKLIKCKYCGKDSHNYANGTDVCPDCAEKHHICIICGGIVVDSFKVPNRELKPLHPAPITQAMSSALGMIKNFNTGTSSRSNDRMIIDYNDDRYIATFTKVEDKDEDMFKDIDKFIK